jgi:hypothetical protein
LIVRGKAWNHLYVARYGANASVWINKRSLHGMSFLM